MLTKYIIVVLGIVYNALCVRCDVIVASSYKCYSRSGILGAMTKYRRVAEVRFSVRSLSRRLCRSHPPTHFTRNPSMSHRFGSFSRFKSAPLKHRHVPYTDENLHNVTLL